MTNIYPPQIVSVIQTHSRNCIRGLDINFTKLYLFTATNKGDISLLDLGQPGKEKLISEKTYFGGNIEIRVIRYNPADNEVITGDQIGKVTIWSLKTGQPVFAWQAHTGAITQMRYEMASKVLLTAGKDKRFVYWKLPDTWLNEAVAKFEANEIKNINDSYAMMKIQKTLSKVAGEEEDSSDDSLNGWDIRP